MATEDVEIDNIWRVFKTRTLLPLDTLRRVVYKKLLRYEANLREVDYTSEDPKYNCDQL